MKLLVFSPYYPPHIGGLESHADEFNKYLSQKGVDITVFTPRLPEDAPEKKIKYTGVTVIRFPAFEIISNYPMPEFWSSKFWRLFFSLFEEKFDIVISRTRFFNTSLLALTYAKIKKVRWIHIEHGSDFVQLSSSFKTSVAKAYDHLIGRLIFRSSNLNISISDAVRKFVAKFDKRESPIIHRGIDISEIEKIAPDFEFKKKFENKIIIAWAGRLYKWKGVKNSIEAIKGLPREIKNRVIFVIIGDGEDMERLRSIADDSIVFTGSLSREKVIGILKIAEIYIHSSEPGGGLSTSLLEAMLCDCAVIATPHEGADEVIEGEKSGLLMKKGDSSEIAEKIKEMINNREKSAYFSQNSRNFVKEKFNWDASIELYERIFNDK